MTSAAARTGATGSGPRGAGEPPAVRVGVSLGTFAAGTTGDEARAAAEYVVRAARAAAAADLDSLSVGDHHATGPVGYLQNAPVLGRLLAEWAGRPVGCLFLVPLWHPVLLAEQVGTLATLAEAPFVLQVGMGSGAGQFAAMGVPVGERVRRTEESVRVVKALLRGETVDSPLWGVTGARVAPLPPAGVEWWVGGGVRTAVERAARLGDAWYGNADLTLATAKPLIDQYREACGRLGVVPARIPVRKDVFIAEDASFAERVGDALVARGYRGFERGAVAYGDPHQVAEQLQAFVALGFTDIVLRTMRPLPEEVDPGAAVASVELAGEVRALLRGGATPSPGG